MDFKRGLYEKNHYHPLRLLTTYTKYFTPSIVEVDDPVIRSATVVMKTPPIAASPERGDGGEACLREPTVVRGTLFV